MESGECGKVYLIGAGPGDPRLITFRALELLTRSDVVCFDALVDPTIIASLPGKIERFYVGKRAGVHSMSQQEIEQLLITLARAGKTVARLKGGDPFVFGRGGEEALALRKAGVSFEIVPGVTAATAVTAYAGIPLTHRGMATWTILFTAHEAGGKDPEVQLPFNRLAALGQGTLAGYMGIRQVKTLCGQLIDGGMNPATPAAVIERGTTPAQRIVTATIETLEEEVKHSGIKPPGLIVVGETIRLRNALDWYSKGPLAGKRVLVTRPASQAGKMYEQLRELGASVVPAPSILVENHYDPGSCCLLYTSDAADE